MIESQKFEVDESGMVFAVSDGMGGALAGEVASKMAVETVSEVFWMRIRKKQFRPKNLTILWLQDFTTRPFRQII